MLRIISALFITVATIFLLINIRPVLGQNTSNTDAAVLPQNDSSGEVLGLIDIIKSLFSLLIQNNVTEEVREYNKKSLPLLDPDQINVSGVNISVTPDPTAGVNPVDQISGQEGEGVADAAYQYCLSEQVEEDPLDADTFFGKILTFFRELFGTGVVDTGNKCAQDALNAQLPPGVGSQALSRINTTSNLAMSENSKVLGSTPGVISSVSDQAMVGSFDCSRCAGLPLALCSCGDFAGTNPDEGLTPVPEPTGPTPGEPEPTGDANPSQPGNLPAVCFEKPTCLDGNRADCYKNSNAGQCFIYTKGFCSVDCLKPYFGGDKLKAEKASQVCNRESGGNPYIVNRSCLYSKDGINNDNDGNKCIDLADNAANFCPVRYYDGATVDYSIGLFQINLLAHCSASAPKYTWDPPTCTFGSNSERDKCEKNFTNPEENIKYAVKLSQNGTYWKPWSAAGPAYCNIK
ncbi:hypothetical protein A3E42_00020 [Candidatus Gottesmanbacteria bacterium RIFCSPHIGHO2_12_FULL_40_13]|nr:MAG: hypothetical protein A3E42_00020 [Candidatus Gottesmanbacteria bacterium RIFCSPHIGHO2_12_FULL_40_13]